MDTSTLARDPASGADENIVCGCTSLSVADLRRRISENPSLSFENLTAETGAGTKCTACLLDLEYHFVEAQREPGAGPAHKADDGESAEQAVSFKRKLYRWLDSISPRVSYPLSNTVPVLFGYQIEQWVWITNRSMLFEGNVCAPLMKIELIIRDESGQIVETVHQDVSAESTLRYNVSARLAATVSKLRPGQLYAGSVEIRRAGDRSGIRGTTRPQIEVVTPAAACAVHSQAMSGPGQYWFSCLNRPTDERMYFAILNGADREQTLKISYPVDIPGLEPLCHEVAVPARGAVLHQMNVPDTHTAAIGSKAFTITWRSELPHKLWAICTTPQLDRFSIDHT